MGHAESAERYEDMCCFMHKRVKDFPDKTLSVDDRNLLSVAYKNVIGARRASWRTLQSEIEQHEDPTGALGKYKKQIEAELESICKNVLALLTNQLIKEGTNDDEETVFYLKMAGDYNRYLAESVHNENYKEDRRVLRTGLPSGTRKTRP